MKRKISPINILLRFFLSFILLSGGLLAAPYGPDGRSINWEQPDGTKIKLKVMGDNIYARTVTTDGYTVVHNPKDQAYYYAKLNQKQDQFIPTGQKVVGQKVVEKPPANLKKNIKLKPEARKRQFDERNQRFNAETTRTITPLENNNLDFPILNSVL